uniref:type I secretion C-terminal target domain-containing protein n=1 Tax=Desulfovibrio cuneatus TaxID=159728 RepID=UPI0004889AF2
FKDYFDVSIDASGQLTLTLNQAGKDFLAAQGGNNAYGYITLTDASGVEYTVQVVLNQNDNVASKSLDGETAGDNGGYDLANGGLKHGEWHQGQALNNGNLSSSDLDDHIRFTGVVSGSSIDAGKGYDIVYLGGLKGTNTVTADGGTVTVEQVTPGSTAYSMTTTGGSNTITTDSADVILNASGNAGTNMYAENGSNSVKTATGDISLTAHSDIHSASYGMYTKAGGTNTLEATEGSVSIDVSGEGEGRGLTNYSTVDAGQNNITAGKDIDIDVHMAKSAYGMSGQGTLKAGGDISIDATSQELGATGISNTGTTVVEAGGKLTVHAANLNTVDEFARMNSGTSGVSSNGSLNIKAESIDISASSTGSKSSVTGIVQNTGTTTMEATNDISISSTKESAAGVDASSASRGIYTWGNTTESSLDITSTSGNITISADDNSVFTTGSGGSRSEGANAINMAGGNVDVTLSAKNGTVSLQANQEIATPGSYAWGVNNQSPGTFTIEAKQAQIDVKAAIDAKGLVAQTTGAENRVTADTVNMTITGTEKAVAMDTYMSGSTDVAGKNTITARTTDGAGQVNINLGGGFVTGMSASRGGQNLIDADHVQMNADVTGWATGMTASDTASNTIISNDVDLNLKGYTGVGMVAGATSSTTPTATNLVQGTGDNASFTMNLSGTGGQYSKVRGMEASAGGQNIIKDFASVNITGVSSGEAAAMYTSAANSQNTIASTGDITLNTQSTGGIAYGANAYGGTNSLSAGGDVNITATSNIATGTTASGGFYVPNAYGLRAEAGGKNEITQAENVTITASNPGAGFASAMDAKSGGTNSIANVSGNVTVGGGNYGMQADGTGSSNTISTVGGNVTVSGTASGMGGYRTSGGSNTITEVGGNVKIDAGSKGIAMDNWGNSTNTISHVTGNVDLYGGNGMYVFGYGGKNSIDDVKGSVSITGGLNMYTGVSSNADGNTISNVAGNVTLNSTGSFNIDTVSGKNSITNVGGDVRLTGANTAIFTYGTNVQTRIADVTGNVLIEGQLTVDNNGETLIENVGKNVTIGSLSVQSNGGTNTVRTVGGDVTIANAMTAATGKNEITDVEGRVFVNGGNNSYVAMSAASKGQNIISAKGDVAVQAASTGSVTYGVQADTSGKNIILSDKNVTVSAQNLNPSSGTATGMAATNSGTNTLNAGGDVTVNATTNTGMAYAVYANGAGANTINGVNIDIIAKNNSGTQSLGVYSLGGGTNTITGTGPVSVDVSSATNAWGLYAGAGSQNNLSSTSSLSVMTTAVAGQAIGVAAKGAGAQNTLTGNDITLAATAGTTAVGLNAEAGGTNTVNELGGGLTITASGGTSSSAMNAGSGGHNLVNATGDVSLVTETASGIARGLQAVGGTNTLTLSKSLSIDVNNAAPGANSYSTAALFATDKGVNLIQANDGSTGLEVRITVTAGNGGKAYAMYAESLGENRIVGSEKADFITIKGDIIAIYGGQNSISTGGGDDRVVLDGAVNGGGLTLEMGAGHDILTLKAKDFAEFKGRYETWLNALMATGHGVESIEIIYNETWSAQDKADLHNFFGGAAFQNVEVLFPEVLLTGTEVHSDMGNVFHEGDFDGTLSGGNHSDHTFASTQDDVVRVTGDVSHTDLTFAGGGHDTLTVAGNLIDAHVTTESTYTGTLHVDAGGLENAQMNLMGGTNAVTLHGTVDNLSTLVLGDGNDTLSIQGDFTGQATMGAGNDYVVLHGSAHGGIVDGGAGNDTLIGDAGNNILVGGSGHDVLTGGTGADTFVWKAGDAGTADAPATDVVTDFNIDEGDKLDLSGLLTDGAKDNLDNYLNVTHENGNTVLNISTSGESAEGRFDQVIVLENSTITAEQLMQQLLLTQ